MIKQTGAVWKAINFFPTPDGLNTSIKHTAVFAKMNPHSARSYETDTKSSCGSEVRPKLPFAVPGLLGQANRGRLEHNLCHPTPAARSHMPMQHNAVFARGKKHGAGGDVKEPQNSWDSRVRSIPPFAVPGLHGQANNGRPKGNLCRPTPARCYITHAHTTHGHFFFLSNPPTAPGTTKRTPTAEGAPTTVQIAMGRSRYS